MIEPLIVLDPRAWMIAKLDATEDGKKIGYGLCFGPLILAVTSRKAEGDFVRFQRCVVDRYDPDE